MKQNFSCPRTCPRYGDIYCRFRPLFDILGPVVVNSHTVRVKVNFGNADALKAAVKAMGGEFIGVGDHSLFQGCETGIGFRLPGWLYPLVAKANGELAYDDYGGRWGNTSDIEKLKGEYTLALAAKRCQQLGWQYEVVNGVMTVYHPSGGVLTVTTEGTVDAVQFIGSGCHDAIMALELGEVTEATPKPEFTQCELRVRQ